MKVLSRLIRQNRGSQLGRSSPQTFFPSLCSFLQPDGRKPNQLDGFSGLCNSSLTRFNLDMPGEEKQLNLLHMLSHWFSRHWKNVSACYCSFNIADKGKRARLLGQQNFCQALVALEIKISSEEKRLSSISRKSLQIHREVDSKNFSVLFPITRGMNGDWKLLSHR